MLTDATDNGNPSEMVATVFNCQPPARRSTPVSVGCRTFLQGTKEHPGGGSGSGAPSSLLTAKLRAGGTAATSEMAKTAAHPAKPLPAAVEYPYSDGKVMAETPRHVDAIIYALATLRNWFAGHARVQVGANMFVYYQEGDPRKRLTPDLFVVRGLEALPEPSFKIWEAGRPPTFVLEVASPSTAGRDRGEKQALYAAMGVAEYWRFDPAGRLKGASRPGARFEGGALQGLGYKPMDSGPDGSIRSEVLGLEVRVDERPGQDHLLRFRDPKSGKDLLTFEESEAGRLEAERGRREAEERLRKAELAHREVMGRLRARIAGLEPGQDEEGPDRQT